MNNRFNNSKMNNVIGIDVGGTSIVGGRVEDGQIVKQVSADTRAEIGGDITLDILKNVVSQLITPETKGIGFGVPSVVDRANGIVLNVQNINDWDEVHIKDIFEAKFDVPVYVDNDANCFAMGENIFGQGRSYRHFVGITLGTGVGGGIVQSGHLLEDANCGSGEFGELPYLDGILEDYCGSSFFPRFGNMSGYEASVLAEKGDKEAIKLFEEYGKHMSILVKNIMLIIDPQAIILGGSISKSLHLFEKSMFANLNNFPYPKSVERIKILKSEIKDPAVLGAASLCLNR